MNKFTRGILHRSATGGHRTMRPFIIVLNICVGDKPSTITKRRRHFVHINNRTKSIKPKQFPRSAIMITFPTTIQHMAKTKISIFRSCRGKRLPCFILISWATEHDHSIDLLMFCKPRCSGGTMRATRNNNLVPTQALTIFGNKITPVTLRVFLFKILHKLVCTLHHAIGFRNIHHWAKVFACRCFQTNLTQEFIIRRGGLFTKLTEPTVCIMNLDCMKPIAGNPIK